MDRWFRAGAALFAVVSALLVARPAVAEDAVAPPPPQGPLRDVVPPDVSPEARAIYQKLLPGVAARRMNLRIPHTLAEFDARDAANVAGSTPGADATIKALGAATAEFKLGGVGVFETRPPQFQDDGTVLIRVHGGGFIQGSAHSSAAMDAVMARALGRRILSIDYTVAPRGKWNTVTDQVIAVYKAVLAQGYEPRNIGMYGDSAGANIVPASVLKLRDEGLPMPAAVVLLSPCIDFTRNSDTEMTLRDDDPVLWNQDDMVAGLGAYADPADWKNPYVSPIFGDFTRGFPPVLLQVGTREILLSDSVRFYQAIKTAGGDAELDVYEGMAHVFQSYMAGTPEQKQAFAEMARFWSRYLIARKP
ncbi:MAG TPA: alpha/beta hydrolase [Rhizomicrobium sp.]